MTGITDLTNPCGIIRATMGNLLIYKTSMKKGKTKGGMKMAMVMPKSMSKQMKMGKHK